VLCPSFYRAELVFNPTGFDRFVQKLRAIVIGFFQRRADRRRLRHAF
jgi:indolepyruvate ferredoxin oxidoreductase alpha subunit